MFKEDLKEFFDSDELAEDATKAVSAYASDVRSGLFPNQSETYHASSAVEEEISIYGSKLNS